MEYLQKCYLRIRNKTIIKIEIKINFLLKEEEKDFFINNEEPHLTQTILPPKDRSDTNDEHPQLKQTIFLLI